MLKAQGTRGLPWRLPALSKVMASKHPAVSVTQGGSGQKFSGAKSAATKGEVKVNGKASFQG